MDLQKAIDQISNKGESVEVTVGTPETGEQASAKSDVGIGSMDSSVSASIDQAISNVGMSPEGTATPVAVETPATTETTEVVAAPVAAEPAATPENPGMAVVPEVTATTPEADAGNKDVKLKLAEALLPNLEQTNLSDSEKAEVCQVLWDSGNRDTKVISGMIETAKEDPAKLSEMWRAI